MEFDFYKKYQTLSDEELMHICNNPSRYQPRAVEDARRVLQEREVDIVASAPEEPQPVVQSALLDKVGRFFEEPATPANTWDFDKEGTLQEQTKAPASVVKWHWALLGAFTIFSISSAYNTLKLLVLYIQMSEEYRPSFIQLAILLIAMAIDVAIICGIYKRKPWAWSLAIGYSCLNLSARVVGLYQIFMNPYTDDITDYWQGMGTVYLLINIGFCVLLYQPFMRSFYGSGDKRRKNTLLVSAGIFILYLLLLYLLENFTI